MREEECRWASGVVLVCKNQRAPGVGKPSCGEAAGHELKSWLKQKARTSESGLSGARVLTTSCLDACSEDGLAVAVEPGRKLFVVDAELDRNRLFHELEKLFDASAEESGGRGLARRALSRLRKG